MPCLCCSASVPSSRSFLETSSVFQVFNFNSIFNAYLFFSVCSFSSLLFPISKEMGTAYAQVGHSTSPLHLRSALTKCSHHLFLLHISLIDPLLTELSPKTTDDGLPTDCVGLCTACLWLFRTDLDPASTAPRLPRLAPVHTQYRFLLATPAHTCPHTFELSFSPSFCSLFCTCQSLPALHSGNSIGSGSISIFNFQFEACVRLHT